MNYFKKYIFIFLLLLLGGCNIKGFVDKNEDNIAYESGVILNQIKENNLIYNNSNMENDLIINNYLDEIKVLITAGENIKAEAMYVEIISKYPEHEGIKEGYNNLTKNNLGNINSTENEIVNNYLAEIKVLITAGENTKAEEKYNELIEKYPNHEGIKEGYDNFKSISKVSINLEDNEIINNYLEEIKVLINSGETIKVDEKYKELIEKYPNHEGIKEGYDNFKIISQVNINLEDNEIINNYLAEIKVLITAGETIKVDEKYKELIKKYPNHKGIQEGYDNFIKSTL